MFYEYWWLARVYGNLVLDAIQFNGQPIEMTLLGVTQASGVAYLGISGIIGLAPSRGIGDLYNFDNFIQTLYLHGAIQNASFGLLLSQNNSEYS